MVAFFERNFRKVFTFDIVNHKRITHVFVAIQMRGCICLSFNMVFRIVHNHNCFKIMQT